MVSRAGTKISWAAMLDMVRRWNQSALVQRSLRKRPTLEVADPSLKIDRQEKAEINVHARVPEYWVVNLAGRIIERHSEPTDGTYARVTPFRSGETVAPLAFADVELRLDEVFGG
jgi:hypothetical protein